MAENAVPKAVKDACCELARLLLVSDRTADISGSGVNTLEIAEAITIKFDPNTAPTELSDFVQQMLSPLGDIIGNRGGTVRLVRS